MEIEEEDEIEKDIEREDKEEGIKRLDSVRKERIEEVEKRGKLKRLEYKEKGILEIGRNMIFEVRRKEILMKDMEWIYGYEEDLEVRK